VNFKTPRLLATVIPAVLAMAFTGIAAAADAPGGKCASLAQDTFKNDAHIERAESHGAACVLHGSIISSPTSTIQFRIDLPSPKQWGGRLMYVGGGGFDGYIPTDSPVRDFASDMEKLKSYVMVSADSGHQGRGAGPAAQASDFSWVTHNPTALKNHAYEANHLVLWATVDVAQKYYGTAPKYRYMIGASNGGRAGLVSTQHFPSDYQGVISLEPAISQEAFGANMPQGLFKHLYADPENWLDHAHVALYQKAEIAACDALDGLEDGIISNPNACTFDAAALLCKSATSDRSQCLTAGQVETIHRINSDKHVEVTLADGYVGYPAHGRTAGTADWEAFIFGHSFAGRDAIDFLLADNIVKWGITADPNASLMTHDATQWSKSYLELSNEIDATNPDLSQFHEHGGKLLVWFGLADGCVTHKRAAQYLDAVAAKVGKPAFNEFVRFFTSPAVGHMMTGPGPYQTPFITAIEAWAERGKAPEELVSTRSDAQGKPLLSRPLCQYPLYPNYNGKGDPNQAMSFRCSAD
jgi:Tannase and feruloyl esterase